MSKENLPKNSKKNPHLESLNSEIPKDKKDSAKAASLLARSWDKIRKDWKKSAAVLGVGTMMTTPGLAQNMDNGNQKADEQFSNQDKKRHTYVVNGQTLEQKRSRAEAEKTYEASIDEFEELKVKADEKRNSYLRDESSEEMEKMFGSGENFRAEIPTSEGIKLFEGLKGEKEFKEYQANRKKAFEYVADPEKNMGLVEGEGASFRAEVPFRGGIRLLLGEEGEKEYAKYLDNLKKSGGRIGNNQNVQNTPSGVVQKTQERPQINVRDNGNDAEFFAEVPTRDGPRTFEGKKGKKEFEKFMAQRNGQQRR